MFEPFDSLTSPRRPGARWVEIVCGFAAAALFLFFGLGASWAIGRMIYDGHRARAWVPVQATVNAFDPDSAAYHYEFRGVRYGGHRLGTFPLPLKDNLDSWQESMASSLKSAHATGKPIKVWIDPDHPAESMIDRDIRWAVALAIVPFALGFCAMGFGALWLALRRMAGSPAYEANERSPAIGRIVMRAFYVAGVLVGALVVHQSISNLDWEGMATGAIVAVGSAAMLMRGRKSRPDASRPLNTTRPTAREAADTLARFERSKRAGRAAAQEMRQALAFTPSFMMSDRFPYLVFGLAAAIIIVIGLMILIVGPGHA